MSTEKEESNEESNEETFFNKNLECQKLKSNAMEVAKSFDI